MFSDDGCEMFVGCPDFDREGNPTKLFGKCLFDGQGVTQQCAAGIGIGLMKEGI